MSYESLVREYQRARTERERVRSAIHRRAGALLDELEELRHALDDEADSLARLALAVRVTDDASK